MSYFHWIVGGILALAWFSRLLDAALGMPRVADISRPEWDPKPGPEPRVSIIVPARNEEQHIEPTLLRLLALAYKNYEVIAVNDRSTDRTGAAMDRVLNASKTEGRLRVIHVDDLPPGWMGKPHAMWSAGKQANGDWLLFTDADVLFKPESLRRAVNYAESQRVDHLVLFPRLVMHSPGERMMIAFFQTLFVFGHRPWKVADAKTKDHMGVGAFNLIRRRVYEAIGTYQALRFEVLDDMKLGKLVKNAGYRQRVVFGEDLISLRWVKGVMGMAENLTKNMFAVVSFQPRRMLATVFTLVFLNLLPFLGVWFAHGWARAGYVLALVSIAGLYVGMSRMSDVPAYYCFLHPVSSVMFAYILLRSMVLTLRQQGIFWRGTFYPLDELRKGMV